MKPATASPPAPWWQQTWLLALLLVAAIIFAYQPAWQAGFIWDDDYYVTQNPLITAPEGLSRIWFSTDSPSQYFPLTYTSFRLQHALWGFNASGYHWFNILLHAVNALLVWRLLGRLAIPGAWLAAAIFALHPVQVESVAWVTELKNIQSLFFMLLALLAWVEFISCSGAPSIARHDADGAPSGRAMLSAPVQGEGRGEAIPAPENNKRWLWYALALLCHALALFSKTTACTLPAALVLILWLRKQPINWSRAAQIVPFVLLGLGMGLLTMWWERHKQGTEGAIFALSFLERVLVASRAAWFYLGKVVWPTNLTFSYPLWKINPADPLAYIWLIAGVGLAAAIFYARRWFGRSVEVAAVFFIAMLSPLLGFIMLYTFRYTFVADHYQYVAVLGPAALAAAALVTTFKWMVNCSRRRKEADHRASIRLVTSAATALLLTLSTLTWRQSRMYSDLETLWQTTLARNPDSAIAHNNLGTIRLERGEVDEAMTHFHRVLEIHPDHANGHGNLGNAFLQIGRVDDAIRHFQKAVSLEPDLAKGYSDLAWGLLQKGQIDEAMRLCRRALEIQPNFVEARHNLGWCLLENNRLDEAIAQFQKAIASQPYYADAYHSLGTALLRQNQLDGAIAQFENALKYHARLAKTHNNLGTALLQKGDLTRAIEHFQTTLQLQPNNLEARNNLGYALLQNGQPDAAAPHFETVLRADPNFANAHYHLGHIHFQRGQVAQAVASLQKALALQPRNAEIHHNLGWIFLQSGRTDEAIAHYQKALKLEPGLALTHNNLANAFLRKGDAHEAIQHFQTSLKLQPENPRILSDLAWVLATWPEPTVRDGGTALELARKANQLSGGKDPLILRALAAAYAEAGKFPDAVTTAQRAAQLAEAGFNLSLRNALHAQIKLYQSAAPFRDPPQTTAAIN